MAVGAVATPILITGLAPAFRGREGELWRPAGRDEDFPLGEVTEAIIDTSRPIWPPTLGRTAVYVWRPVRRRFGAMEKLAFSALDGKSQCGAPELPW